MTKNLFKRIHCEQMIANTVVEEFGGKRLLFIYR